MGSGFNNTLNMSSLSNKILSDPINKWVFSNAGTEVYLVGGFLRDSLLSSGSSDLDYVVRVNPEKVARKVLKKFKGTFINLNRNSTFRIVLKNKQFIDFTSLETSIEENLAKRDFTVNAMAWSPEKGLIDPLGGLKDLRNNVIRAVRSANFKDDPLRVLRAYRHAVQLGFTINKQTRSDLTAYANRISETASERITDELYKILNHHNADIYLKECFEDMVLDKVLILNKDRLRENLKMLSKYRLLIKKISGNIESDYKLRKFQNFLNTEISQGLTRVGLIRLSLLLLDSFNTKKTKKNLRFSYSIKKAVKCIHTGFRLSKERVTNLKLYEIFTAASDYSLETAHIISLKNPRNYKKILKSAEDYLTLHKKSLLSGDEIKKILHVQQGVFIGKIKSDLQQNRFLKKIKTKAEARAWILSNFI